MSATPTYTLLGRHTPEMPVAFGPEGPITADRLRRQVAVVAAALPEARVDADGRPSAMLVLGRDRHHFVINALAAWSRGHIVALPPNERVEAVRAVVGRSDVLLAIHDTDLDADRSLDTRALLHGVDLETVTPSPLMTFSAHQPMAVVYTSGSTGDHQPCPKTAAQLLGEAQSHIATFGFGPADVIVSTVPSHHLYGLLFGVLVPLLSGACYTRATPLHAEAIRMGLSMESRQATALVSVPAHLRHLADTTPALPALRHIFSSAAPLNRPTALALRDAHDWTVTEVLGSSETGGIAWRHQLDEPRWTPLDGVAVTEGEGGRLHVDSVFVARELPRPVRSGDRIQRDADGRFTHLGRVDGVTKIAGKRVALQELTARLLSLRGVHDVEVRAIPVEGPRGAEIWAAIAAMGWTPRRLKAALGRWFDPSVLPRRIRLVEGVRARLPREDTGKFTAAAFDALFKTRPAPAAPPVDFLFMTPFGTEPEAADGADRMTFRVDPNYWVLQGHFDGFPILPGVAQLNDLILKRARVRWPNLGALTDLTRLKFRQPITPAQQIEMVLKYTERASGAAVAFTLTANARPACSGTFNFAPLPTNRAPAHSVPVPTEAS